MSPMFPRDLLVPYFHPQYDAPCNVDCFFCYERPHVSPGSSTPVEEIVSLFSKGKDAGYTRLYLGSGELVLHPGWREIIAAAKELGFGTVGVLSNLSTISPARLDELLASGINEIFGTMAVPGEEFSRLVYGRDGIFGKQVETLKELGARSGVPVGIHLLQTRQNLEAQKELMARVLELLGRMPMFALYSTMCITGPDLHLHDSFSDGIGPDWEGLLEYWDERGLPVITQNVPSCHLGKYSHRNWGAYRMLARALAGWPESRASRELICNNEPVHREFGQPRLLDSCVFPSLCQRVHQTPCLGSERLSTVESAIERSLTECGWESDPELLGDLAAELERMVAASMQDLLTRS